MKASIIRSKNDECIFALPGFFQSLDESTYLRIQLGYKRTKTLQRFILCGVIIELRIFVFQLVFFGRIHRNMNRMKRYINKPRGLLLRIDPAQHFLADQFRCVALFINAFAIAMPGILVRSFAILMVPRVNGPIK